MRERVTGVFIGLLMMTVAVQSAERIVDGIRILPWRIFLENLWDGRILS